MYNSGLMYDLKNVLFSLPCVAMLYTVAVLKAVLVTLFQLVCCRV